MPLFARTDPDLRALIGYVVARAGGRGITLNRAKVVKLLYLIDVERVRTRRAPLTGVAWTFSHQGPHADDLPGVLKEVEASRGAEAWGSGGVYEDALAPSVGDDWPVGTKLVVDQVVERFASADLDELLDHVYFHTGPMLGAEPGQPLDLERARDDAAPRRSRPLPADPPPAGLDERLARWRAAHAARLAPLVLDPPGTFLGGPPAATGTDPDPDPIGVRGRLRVAATAER